MKTNHIVKKNIYKELCKIETEIFNTCIITHGHEQYKCDLFKKFMDDCNKFKNIKQRSIELNELKQRKIEK